MAAGKHEGFEETAWDGLQQSIDAIAEKGIKVVINGGGLAPERLARKTTELVRVLAQEWMKGSLRISLI